MNKIVVGIDLSPQSEQTLGHAVGVARRAGAEVVMVLVDVVPDLLPPVDPSSLIIAERFTETLQQRLSGDRAQLAELLARWQGRGAELSSLVVDGHADERLPAVAEELAAGLIVVGSHGRTGVKRWFLGSVAERVVRMASCSVLVTRGEAPAAGYQRVVIGTDFSDSADRAILHALPLLAPGARIALIHSWPSPWAIPEAAIVAYDSMRSAVLGKLTEAARRLTTTLHERGRDDVQVEGRPGEAPPAVALTEAAAAVDADLVVVGSHGRRGVRRFLLGSVAEVTVRHAPCSVLVSR